jgi:serine/threonine protein kinase
VRARFSARRALQIAHPSIIQVRDYGEEGDLIYLVTDFIEGRSLREVLQTDGPMPWRRLRPLLAQLVEAARRCTGRTACCAASARTSCAWRSTRTASG